jgi:hypothetical protein
MARRSLLSHAGERGVFSATTNLSRLTWRANQIFF